MLLNHLLTRLRVSLTETTVDNDPFLAGCFKGSADRPDLAFKVHSTAQHIHLPGRLGPLIGQAYQLMLYRTHRLTHYTSCALCEPQVSGPDDMRFSELSTRGTRLAFHGSPPENFFSIVSLGLKNLSGTS